MHLEMRIFGLVEISQKIEVRYVHNQYVYLYINFVQTYAENLQFFF